MCFYNPWEVLSSVKKNETVSAWLEFIAREYVPPKKYEVLLMYPCSTVKPYNKSRSYKTLYKTLNKIEDWRDKIHLVTVSEPYGLVPEELHESIAWYDCPGLFSWWCQQYKQPYEVKPAFEAMQIIAESIAGYLERTKRYYTKRIACIRAYTSKLLNRWDHTHSQMITMGSLTAGVDVEIFPDKELVAEIVEKKGAFSWNVSGVRNQIVQDHLLEKLR